MYVTLFNLAGFAIVAWLLLILLPKWRVTRFVARWAVFPVFLSVLYVVGLAAQFGGLGGAVRDFGTAEGVVRLLARADVALLAWIHILAFDQLAALYIYRDNMEHRYVPLPVQSVLLFLTLMFGPVGFLSYYLLRLARRRHRDAANAEARDARTGDAPADVSARAAASTDPSPGRASRFSAALAARLPSAFVEERALVWLGLLGVALGTCLLAVVAARGRFVAPEGDLYKAGTFNLAVGIYLLTLTLFVPLSGLTERGLRRWRSATVVTGLYVYAVETVQMLRGIDPRFTRAGGVVDQLLGALMGLMALLLIVLFVILVRRFLFGGTRLDGTLLLPAVRYACAGTGLAFAAGLWMSAAAGSRVGAAGNLLPLHAAGFHALQAVPLVALLFMRAGATRRSARRWIHATGVAWLGLCAGLAWQTVAGRSVLEPAPAVFFAALSLLVWLLCAARAVTLWRTALSDARRPAQLNVVSSQS